MGLSRMLSLLFPLTKHKAVQTNIVFKAFDLIETQVSESVYISVNNMAY